MKKFLFALLFVFSFSVFSLTVEAQEINSSCNYYSIYEDVGTGNAFCVYIEYLAKQEIVSQNQSYNPSLTINRGQLSKMIVKSMNLEIDSSGEQFSDVPPTHTFFSEIMTLKNLGVIDGQNGQFNPDDTVSRGAIMKFVVNAAIAKNPSLFSTPTAPVSKLFTDLNNDHSFAPFVNSAMQASRNINEPSAHIIRGYSNNTFRADQSMTRQEVSKVIANTMKYTQIENISCSDYFCQQDIMNELRTDLESRGHEMINIFRAEQGKAGMSVNSSVLEQGRVWSENMASKNILEHNSNLLTDIQAMGASTAGAAENVSGWQVPENSTKDDLIAAVEAVHNQMFDQLPPNDFHRQNILGTNQNYNEMGVGIAIEDEDGQIKLWFTQIFNQSV